MKKKYEEIERRDKTCRNTFEIFGKSGEDLPLLFDYYHTIYITIYADAISLAIPACTNG